MIDILDILGLGRPVKISVKHEPSEYEGFIVE